MWLSWVLWLRVSHKAAVKMLARFDRCMIFFFQVHSMVFGRIQFLKSCRTQLFSGCWAEATFTFLPHGLIYGAARSMAVGFIKLSSKRVPARWKSGFYHLISEVTSYHVGLISRSLGSSHSQRDMIIQSHE